MQHILFQWFLACKILQLQKSQNNFNSVKLSVKQCIDIIIEYRALIKLFTFFLVQAYIRIAYLSLHSSVSNITIDINWECYSGGKYGKIFSVVVFLLQI